MIEADEFEPFFNDMFQGPEDNLLEEGELFLRTLQTKMDEQKGIYKEFKKKHKKWHENFKEFEKEFNRYNNDIGKNIMKIKDNKDFFNPALDLTKLVPKFFKGKKDFMIPDWFIIGFFKEENPRFKENIALFTEKLWKSRFTDEFYRNRDRIFEDLRAQVEKVMNIFVEGNNIDSFYLLSVKDIMKGVAEMKMYDCVTQDFIWQILQKTVEYINSVILDFKIFKDNTKNSLNRIKEINFEGDEHYLIELNNISKRNPQEVRVKRYDISLDNEILGTLQRDEVMNPKILLFFVEFLKERNSRSDFDKMNKIYVNSTEFYRKLMPPGQQLDYNVIDYEAIRPFTDRYNGLNHTIFHSFDKILYLVDVDLQNWLVVEIANKPKKEIVVYDSNYRYTGNIHQNIIEIFRAYMVEELKNKGELTEDDSLKFERDYEGRSTWCPQISEDVQKTLFTAMNMKYLAEGSDISSKHYSIEEVTKFKLVLFSLLMRIGQAKDTVLNFELLC